MVPPNALESAWYGGAKAPWWTRPLATLYGALTGTRRYFYQCGWLRRERLPVPVIVIGNLTAGGTGKTPLTIAIANYLRECGYVPGVVSRGYGGRQREPLLLGAHPDPAEVGDEPCLIRQHGFAVAVGRDRSAAARLLLGAGCNVVLADDGLQHYRLARDVEICVIDGARRFGNGRLLPAGPLREPLSRLAGVDFLVSNGAAQAGEHAMHLAGEHARRLRDDAPWPLAAFAGQHVRAVAAIGNPVRFFDSLRAHGIDVIEHAFGDHHAFVPTDLSFADALPVLMTDKDAIKCARFAGDDWWRVPVAAELPHTFWHALRRRVDAASVQKSAHASSAPLS